MKLPSFQFYPGDWRKDPGIQSLSFHDRGVWFEILCLMHESECRGKLMLNGKAMPKEALARLLGLDNQILTTTLTTLVDFGIATVEPNSGILINRRMVRDEALRKIRQNCGKLGGNPRLVNQNTTTRDNQKPTTGVNQKSTPSSSSSSSSSSSKHMPSPAGEGDEANPPEELIPETTPEETKPEPKKREPNLIWDALEDVLGIPRGTPKPKSELSNWGKVCKELKEVGATPDQIHQRADVWRRKYPNTPLTLNTITKHWTSLAPVVPIRPVPVEDDLNRCMRLNREVMEQIRLEREQERANG